MDLQGTPPPPSIMTWSGRPRSSFFLFPPLPFPSHISSRWKPSCGESLKNGWSPYLSLGFTPSKAGAHNLVHQLWESRQVRAAPPGTWGCLQPSCVHPALEQGAARKPVGHVKRPTGSYLDGRKKVPLPSSNGKGETRLPSHTALESGQLPLSVLANGDGGGVH